MICGPLGSLLIRDWMTRNTGLGSDAAASSTLQDKAKPGQVPFFNWHQKKRLKEIQFLRCIVEREEVLYRVLTEALAVNLPSDGSWPACPGSWRGWCGRHPPGSWRGERAAGGTRRGPETSLCFPGKQRQYRGDSQRWQTLKHQTEMTGVVSVMTRRYRSSSAKSRNVPGQVLVCKWREVKTDRRYWKKSGF